MDTDNDRSVKMPKNNAIRIRAICDKIAVAANREMEENRLGKYGQSGEQNKQKQASQGIFP